MEGIKVESQIKVQACKLLNRIFDLRENFILNKFIHWYCATVVKIQAARPKISQAQFNQLIVEEFKAKADQLFPNILKTAYKDFDLPLEKESVLYTNEYHDYYIFDFDYLLKNQPSEVVDEIKRLSYTLTLPTLLYTFAMTEEVELQNTLLELILRCFNQRSTLIRNLMSTNLFSTEDEIQIFTYFSNMIVDLRIFIQSSDTFIGQSLDSSDVILEGIRSFKTMITNLTLGLLKNTKVSEGKQIMFDTSGKDLQLSIDRQTMMKNLKLHEIVTDFIQKKFGLVEKIIEGNSSVQYKREILSLFQECYSFLVFFVKDNSDNQKAIYLQLEAILGNIKYEVGQIDLLCAVVCESNV